MSLQTILVIEDSDDMRELMKQALLDCDCLIDDASCGQEGLNYLHSGKYPDLILLDLGLGDMDGSEFIERFSKMPARSACKVIVVSGNDLIQEKAAEIKADGWIKKPFDLSFFCSEVKKYLTN